MKTASLQIRLTSLLFAALTSATVLGATVAGMQSGTSTYDVVAMDPHVAERTTAVQ